MSNITSRSTVADIATADPATIRVFQRHHIDFCCGGRVSLAHACEQRGLDPAHVVDELRAALDAQSDDIDWRTRPLTDLVAFIQSAYHAPMRLEIARLSQMLAKVISRHGDRMPEIFTPLRATFESLQEDLLEHMAKEDAVLFPAIVALESGAALHAGSASWRWLEQPIQVMEREHQEAGAALDAIRRLTRDYTPPDWACPTFKGLYYGLQDFEREMHQHVHLENHILFPRATRLATIQSGVRSASA